MAQLVWKKITFNSDEEYYETLGFLSKEDNRPIDLFIEDNRPSGAFGVERRFRVSELVDIDCIPRPLAVLFEDNKRPSVSDYFKNLQENHSFTRSEINPGTANASHIFASGYNDVLVTVPNEYQNAFNRGYHWNVELLKVIRNASSQTNDDGDVETHQEGDVEGHKKGYYTTRYERSRANREAAIREHGTRCQICGFDFSATYGELGLGYIEVHHKTPLSTLDEAVTIDPSEDLACVCANCHRMLHRFKNYMIGIEELKNIVEDNQ